MNPSEVNTFVIVIKGNEASEYYFEQIKDSWESNGFKLNRYDAYTPDNFEEWGLKFDRSYASKYTVNNIIKEFTPSEKAAFVSHYSLWRKIYTDQIQNALIIEHDAMLRDYNLFRREWIRSKRKYDIKLFGQGASCYSITPRAARQIKNFIGSQSLRGINIWGGPMGYLADMTGNVLSPYKFDRTFERLGGEINLPVAHIYNKQIGNTIDKYSNLPEGMESVYKAKDRRFSAGRWIFIGEENE